MKPFCFCTFHSLSSQCRQTVLHQTGCSGHQVFTKTVTKYFIQVTATLSHHRGLFSPPTTTCIAGRCYRRLFSAFCDVEGIRRRLKLASDWLTTFKCNEFTTEPLQPQFAIDIASKLGTVACDYYLRLSWRCCRRTSLLWTPLRSHRSGARCRTTLGVRRQSRRLRSLPHKIMQFRILPAHILILVKV